MRVNSQALQFDWDSGNRDKNKLSHAVEYWECEEVFFDPRKVTLKDALHSDHERRFVLLGKTRQGRLLYIVFTVRSANIRVISARDINKKEVYLYEKSA